MPTTFTCVVRLSVGVYVSLCRVLMSTTFTELNASDIIRQALCGLDVCTINPSRAITCTDRYKLFTCNCICLACVDVRFEKILDCATG